jgi:hypothetical protein
MDRRRQIRMSEAEVAAFLAAQGHPAQRGLRSTLAAQATKRVGVRFHPIRVSSWDHRKLG